MRLPDLPGQLPALPALPVQPPQPTAQPAAQPAAQSPAQPPLLLLPYRLETRFADTPTGPELWVRIYPAQIAIDTFEPGLTSDEQVAGKAYWTALWRAGIQDTATQQAAWSLLVQAFGAPRAAWIARTMTPQNLGDRPADATPAGTALPTQPTFPQFAPPADAAASTSPTSAGAASPPPAASSTASGGTGGAPLPSRNSSWERAPQLNVLPDRWTVVAYSGGARVLESTGAPVPPSLAIGPNPSATTADTLAEAGARKLPIDRDMLWMVDFDEAVRVGMALCVPLTTAQRASGFDEVIAFGVRATDAGQAGAQRLVELFNAHQYTDGLAFVQQGAATKTTPDAKSAYTGRVATEASFAIEQQGSLVTDAQGKPDPTCNGGVAAALLGIPPDTFAHVQHADGHERIPARHMTTALWPATLGEFMREIAADVFSPSAVDSVQHFFTSFVCPRGPLPAFRVGDIPYGILPVTSLADPTEWKQSPVEPQLVNLLHQLLPIWLTSANATPRVGGTPDPDAELAALIGMEASAMAYRGRHVLGEAFVANTLHWFGVPQSTYDTWWQSHTRPGRALLDRLGFTRQDPKVIHLGLAPTSFPIMIPTIQDGPLSETAPLAPDWTLDTRKVNYLEWLAHAHINDLWNEHYPISGPPPLLFRVLRASLLVECARLAQAASPQSPTAPGAPPSQAGPSGLPQLPGALGNVVSAVTSLAPELINLGAKLGLRLPAQFSPQQIVQDYLQTHDIRTMDQVPELTDLCKSLEALAPLPTAELDRLFAETLDACGTRLDAWVTAVATALLEAPNRTQNSAGIVLGGFAWVENLHPAPSPALVTAAEREQIAAFDRDQQAGSTTPWPAPPVRGPTSDNGGFIHAPSLTQAETAAVLRTGYLTHQRSSDGQLLAIDLSSDRVQRALWFLDGVRQGQSLGALLGYRFEQALHAHHLDTYVQPFRDRYPLVANQLTPPPTPPQPPAPPDALAAPNVVDGLALQADWAAGKLTPGADWGDGLPRARSEQGTVDTILQELTDVLDAIGDLTMAESVYQVVRGNPGSAGATLDAVSRAQRATEPQIVNSPRGGIDITHRLLILFADDLAKAGAWAPIGSHPRAAAEPRLDAWLTTLLPDPALVQYRVLYDAPASGGRGTQRTSETRKLLADLDCGPLDLLALAHTSEAIHGTEIEQRLLYRLTQELLPAGSSNIALDFTGDTQWSPPIAAADVLFAVRSLSDLVGGARALAASDLIEPEAAAHAGVTSAVDATDLLNRANAASSQMQADQASLDSAVKALAALGGAPTAGAAGAVAAALTQASWYGIPGSIPLASPLQAAMLASPSAAGQQAADSPLVRQGKTISTELSKRLAASGAALKKYRDAQAQTPPAGSPADLIAALEALFGRPFVVLPHFTPPNGAQLKQAFGASASLIPPPDQNDPRSAQDQVAGWIQQLTHVRPAVSRFDAAFTAAQLLMTAPPAAPAFSLTLGQLSLPASGSDQWLALPFSNPPDHGRVALATLIAPAYDTQASHPIRPHSGLLVDEWVERIPNRQETTGLTFQYEEPRARAPQSLLLAVPPPGHAGWNDPKGADTLVAILHDTMDLMKIRTVDLDILQAVGQIVPAAYFAFNAQQHTVSTRFYDPTTLALPIGPGAAGGLLVGPPPPH